MKLVLLTALLLPALGFAKEYLPIKHGIYVVQGTSCTEPASANLIGYYGEYLAPGHDSCSFVSVRGDGQRFQAKMSCTNHQAADGESSSFYSNFVIVDSKNFVIGTKLSGRVNYQLYTWCRPKL